jgi:hypothetical protein
MRVRGQCLWKMKKSCDFDHEIMNLGEKKM